MAGRRTPPQETEDARIHPIQGTAHKIQKKIPSSPQRRQGQDNARRTQGITGEVMSVSLKDYVIYVDSVKQKKANGVEVPRPVSPSNVMLTELVIEDRKRRDLLERKTK